MNLQPSPFNLDDLLLRLGLLGAGLLAFNAAADLWAQNDPPTFLFGLALSALAWLAGSAAFLLACASRLNPRWVWLVLGVCLFTQLAYAYLAWWNYAPLTARRAHDETAAELAAQTLSEGRNPYESNPPLAQPPLPALALRALAPLGLGQARTLNFIFYLAALSLIFVNTSPQLRPLILLPLLLWKPFLLLNLDEINGMMWGALLAGVAVLQSRPRWQAVLFGLACSVSQQVWLIAPLLVFQLWRNTRDTKYAIRFAAISLSVFALINIPFLLWNFGAWRASMFALEPQLSSHGLATLTQYGFLPLPARFYSTLQTFAFAAMLAFCWRRDVGPLIWLFPPILLWLSPRGQTSDWVYWLLPFLTTRASGFYAPIKRSQLALSFAATLALAAAFISTPAIEVKLSLPFETSYADQPIITRLKLTVTNRSETMLTPRFAVQPNTGSPPLAWQVDSGPARLAPGESADYVISAGAANKAIPASGGGLVVAYASDDHRRVVLRIPADPSFVKPDHIANPNFYFWGSGTNAPEGWRLELPDGASGVALVQPSSEPVTLVLSVRAESGPAGEASVRLTQRIAFPDSLAVWVHPGNLEAYGFEFDDGSRVLRLLFGELEGREALSEMEVEVRRRAPLNEWSKQMIDLPELYAELGWPLPPYSTRRFRGIEYQARQIEMSLLAASPQNDVTAWFGPIEQSEQTLTARAFVAEALADPGAFYLTLGDAYCRQRNDDLAEAAYRRAQSYGPNDSEPIVLECKP
jgi:hypothetical protein